MAIEDSKELLAKIDFKIEYCTCEGWGNNCWEKENIPWRALRAVVELHEPAIVIYPKEMQILMCMECGDEEGLRYPCPTIQAIEKELN
jgi:hypothetical protein